MTAQNDKIDELIEKYSYAPDFYEQGISDVNSRTSFRDQLIHAACVAGNAQDVAILLSMGADINSPGDMGYTPLHYAVEQGHEALVAFLLRKGADKSIKSSNGDSPLDIAISFNNSKLQQLLRVESS